MQEMYVIEVRFTPQGKILDRRGEIASSLQNDLFEHWRIESNKIQFFSKENKRVGAYFSYKNLGFTSKSPNTKDFFITEAKNFIRKSWIHVPTRHVTRLGLRSIGFYGLNNNFDDIFKKLVSVFLKPNFEGLKKFGDLIDVGFNLDFKENDKKIHVNFGPMDKEQAIDEILGDDDSELPENGVFIDIDYFQDEMETETKQGKILDFIDSGIVGIDKRKELVLNSIK